MSQHKGYENYYRISSYDPHAMLVPKLPRKPV